MTLLGQLQSLWCTLSKTNMRDLPHNRADVIIR
jgi:hypothetical protein